MKLHSQIIGEGQPFLILHGFLGMSDNWKTLGNRFAEDGYEIHLIDQRNHGRSPHSDDFSYKVMASDLKEYLEVHNLSNAIIMGHSMGGKTAMQFAVDYPQKVSKLIVVDISPKSYPQHHQDILKGLSSLNFSEIKSRGEAEKALSKYVLDLGTRQFLLKNLYWKEKGQLALRMNLPVLSENIEEVGKALPPEAKYEGKTLFIKGAKSGYIDDFDSVLIQKHFPNSQVIKIENAGHWVHAENPDDFYVNVVKFL